MFVKTLDGITVSNVSGFMRGVYKSITSRTIFFAYLSRPKFHTNLVRTLLSKPLDYRLSVRNPK